MFQDEAIFGRIGRIMKCWAWNGYRPTVLQQRIRQFRYVFGAVDPFSGAKSFRIYSHCDTITTNHYLKELSKDFRDDYILLICDNAGWHKSQGLDIPDNIEIMFIPPYTPEMNPIEQVWDELREKHFANQTFDTLEKVVDKLCVALRELPEDVVSSIANRKWLCEQFK